MSEPKIRIDQVQNLENRLSSSGSLSNIRISANSTGTVNANGLNFLNTSSVLVSITSGANGNANISFTASGSGGTVVVRDNFTGDGNTTNFTLSTEPEDQNHVLVFVDLVFQSESAFSISGDTLAFTTAPDNGANVDVYIYGGGVGSTVVTSDVFTGTGACTSYQLSQTATTSRTFVYLDGVAQRPQYDYQVSGTALSFNVAPSNTSVIEVRTLSAFNTVDINVAPVTINSDLFTGTGSCTQFTLSQTGTTDSTFVFINGVAQKPGTNYTVGGAGNNILTMASAPANGSVLEVRSMGAFKIIENQSRIDSDIFSGDGNTTTFTLSTSTVTKKVFAFIDGVSQKPFVDYSVGGNRITFTEAPPSGTFIEVRSISPFLFASSENVLKTGDTMTGNLIMSGATINATTANITTIVTGNTISVGTGAGSNANVTLTANGSQALTITTEFGQQYFGFGNTNPSSYADFVFGTMNSRYNYSDLAVLAATEPRISFYHPIGYSQFYNSYGNIGLNAYLNGDGKSLNTDIFYFRGYNDTANAYLSFFSNKLYLAGNGSVGVGTSSPNTTLHINGTTTLQQVKEKVNVSATALDANLTINILDGAVTFLTANSTANSTVNIRGNSAVRFDNVMSNGQSLSTVIMVTNGATGFRIANLQIDSVTVTPRWAGNTVPTANTNSIDVYAFTMIKTAANTYTVLGSKTQFA